MTHLFRDGNPYRDSDSVFGVRHSLIVPMPRSASGRWQLRHKFVLNPLHE